MSLTEHAVRRRIESRTSFSEPTDFDLDAGRPAAASRMLDPDVSPYCFDFTDRKVFCVSTPDIAHATFLYQAQRERARSVVKVPFEALPEPLASPTLIFSIGRCGSTLLQRALDAAGIPTVSEPDYFTQAALTQTRDDLLPAVIARTTQLLRCEVIKLRAECNHAPLLVAGGFRAPKLMFILRDAVEWAASVRRLAPEMDDPLRVATLLQALVGGLGILTQHYDVRVCYYEDFRSLTASYVNALLAWMGSDARLRPARAAELARSDAQEGSVVSRASLPRSSEDPAFRDAFRRIWSTLRPAALIERQQLRGL